MPKTAKESNETSSDHLRSPLHLRPAIQSARLSATGGLVIGGSSAALTSPKKKSPKNVQLAKKKEAEFRKEVMARMSGSFSQAGEVEDKPFDEDERPNNKPYSKRTTLDTGYESDSDKKIDFLRDDTENMTWERRLALKLLKKPWYNPIGDEQKDHEENKNRNDTEKSCPTNVEVVDDFEADIFLETPSLEKAWAFYEHHVLSRYIVYNNDTNDLNMALSRFIVGNTDDDTKDYDMAVPGEDEHPTRLYPWFWTPHRQLGDFGIGIGLYFTTLRYFILLSLLCGLINIPNIMYFWGDEYGGSTVDTDNYKFDSLFGAFKGYLQYGSAECGTGSFVPCPDCQCQTKEAYEANPFFAGPNELLYPNCPIGITADNQTLPFAYKTECDGQTWELAAVNYATLWLVIFGLILLRKHLKAERRKFDLNEQTCRDYSIQILNPPEDANKPEEWRTYFRKRFGAQARVVTCVLANEILLKALVERRELLREIYVLRPGKSLDREDLARAAEEESEELEEKSQESGSNKFTIQQPSLSKLFAKLVELELKIEELSKVEYPVKQVFVTFETEESQRRVLQTLTRMANERNNRKRNGSAFRGEHELLVREPEEPDTIRWLDFGPSNCTRRLQRAATLAFSISLCAIVWFVMVLARYGTIGARYIAPLNVFFLIVMNFVAPLIGKFESHISETTRELATYNRRVLFNIFNYAISPFFTTTFSQTIFDDFGSTAGLIRTVCGTFLLSQIVFPLLELLDPLGRFLRHYAAPRTKTQDAMNLKFRTGAATWDLANQYAQTVAIFVTFLFYSAILPMGFFYCAFFLMVQYVLSKRNLLRSRSVRTGTAIATINKDIYFPFMIAIMAVMSSLFWTGFPYDRLCLIDTGYVDTDYLYVQNVTLDISIASGSKEPDYRTFDFTNKTNRLLKQYQVCDQNFLFNFPSVTFPFVPQMGKGNLDPYAYMTNEQIMSTTVFGWTALAIVIMSIFLVSWRLFQYLRYIKHGRPHNTKIVRKQDDVNSIPYSAVPSIRAYIPEVHSESFAYPLLACNTEEFDENLIHFTDVDRSYKYYDLSVDLKRIVTSYFARTGNTDRRDDVVIDAIVASCLSATKSWEPNSPRDMTNISALGNSNHR